MLTIVHKPGEFLYLIKDIIRNGYLIWKDNSGVRHIMAWTDERKAEDYNNNILRDKPGTIQRIHCSESLEFAKKMVGSGITKMVMNCPAEGDFDRLPINPSEPYSIVDLKKVVEKWH